MKRPFPLLFLAVALTTFSGMVLEIALTRVLSILFFYNYVFVILAVAVLGMGLGAAVVHQRRRMWTGARLGWLALAAGVSVAGLALLMALWVGVDGRIPLAILTLMPYLFIGMVLAATFTMHSAQTTTLYAADLGGAAATIPLLHWLNGLEALLLAAGLLALAALCFFVTEQISRTQMNADDADSENRFAFILKTDTELRRRFSVPYVFVFALFLTALIGTLSLQFLDKTVRQAEILANLTLTIEEK